MLLGAIGIACNAISGLDHDFALGGDDASTAVNDAQNTDSATDSPAVGQDADPDVFPPPPPDILTCPATLPEGMLFCEDFEATKPFNHWSARDDAGLTLEAGVGLDASNGVIAEVACGARCSAALWKALDASTPARLRLRFHFRPSKVDNINSVLGALQGGSALYGVGLFKDAKCPGGGACVDESDPANVTHDFSTATKVTLDSPWHLADVVVTRGSASIAGVVTIDGQQVDARETELSVDAGPTEFAVGLFRASNPGSSSVIIDTITLTTY